MKEILGHKVEKVIVVYRMVYLPCSLATRKYGWSANIERIIKAQDLIDNSMTQYVQSKKTIEEKFAADQFDKTIKDMVWLLFETALLTSGFSLDEPVKFACCIHKLIKLFLTMMSLKKKIPQKRHQKNKQQTNQTLQHKTLTWKKTCHLKFNFVVSGGKKLSGFFFPKLCFLNFKFILNFIFLKYNFQHIQHYHQVANY
ncbi:heat shock protein 90, partial [Reticulomyxa filosa]